MKSRLRISATSFAGASRRSRPTCFRHCSILTPADWFIRWALPACLKTFPARSTASRSARTSAPAGARPFPGSPGWRSISTTGRPVPPIDIDTDPRWQPYKARPLEVGLRACWSTPIKAKDGRVIGTFAFYFRESRAPSRWHQRIVDACVHLGALAIERKEARAQIARLAYHDMLTGLPNRAQLRQLIERAIGDCRGQQLALL